MIQLLQGDALSVLATLAPASIQTVITSPPYYGLRDYGTATWIGGSPDCDHRESSESRTEKSKASSSLGGGKGSIHMSHTYRDTCGKCGAKRDDRQIGQEPIPDCLAWARREPPCGGCYVCALRAVFAAVWRVLRDDGTCWINLGDSHAAKTDHGSGTKHVSPDAYFDKRRLPGVKPKDLLLIPARVALALQSDGWIVRSDVIWSKPNCMPESVTDRPTRAHEYVYLLSKQARYYYDADAIREEASWKRENNPDWQKQRAETNEKKGMGNRNAKSGGFTEWSPDQGRNKRSVWTIATRPFKGSHFAVMPEALIEPCLLASSSAQACEHCGAAWGRVVERESFDRSNDRLYGGTLGHNPSGKVPESNTRGMPQREARDLGFAPRCVCALNTGAACSTVLDCFAGTGTVLRVAERFGRNAIGIELNPDYSELSDARTNGVQKELFV